MTWNIGPCARLLSLLLLLWANLAAAQFTARPPPPPPPPPPSFRPPAFVGGIPGAVPMQTFARRHDIRTALYREALDQLRRNPHAADVPECAFVETRETLCLKTTPGDSKPATVTTTTSTTTTTTPAPAAGKSPPPTKGKTTEKVQAPPPVPAPPAVASKPPVTEIPRRFAVLFGNNDYVAPIPALETPVADVERIAEVLRSRFGFEPRVVRNATKARLIETLNDIASTSRADDSVLLLYAGHGYLMNDIHMGFWIPVDGSTKSPANWVSNADISKMLKAIPARQLILVSDSCFSGSLTKEQAFAAAVNESRDEILQRRAVIAFSSGDEEPVSDEGKGGHSAFAYNLIETLQAINAVTPGYQVYTTVRTRVSAEYEQTPQYGAVISAGHRSGGEYLFEPRH